MKHRHTDGLHHRQAQPDDMADRRHGRHQHPGLGTFDYGALRLVVLAIPDEQPGTASGLATVIEARSSGHYRPGPGVIHPALSQLQDMEYAAVEIDDTARTRYDLTPRGRAFLIANRIAIDIICSRIHSTHTRIPDNVPVPVLDALENLKTALRRRLRRNPSDPGAAQSIATILNTVTQAVEAH